MHVKACLFALATAWLPLSARAQTAQDYPPGATQAQPPATPPPSSPPPPNYRSVPPPPTHTPPPPTTYYTYRYVAPWGWGYYPVYPRPRAVYAQPPPPPPPAQPEPPPSEPDLTYALSFYGAGMDHGYVGGASFNMDSQWIGLDANIDALAEETVTGPLRKSSSSPAGWGSAHLTWSIVSTKAARIRILTGGSMLALPRSDFTNGQPWAGKTLWGPDVGVSGGFGLSGPFALGGWARLTPVPVRVADFFAGAMLHAGPIGLTGGWRWVDVDGDGVEAPKISFSGPQAGLSIRF